MKHYDWFLKFLNIVIKQYDWFLKFLNIVIKHNCMENFKKYGKYGNKYY